MNDEKTFSGTSLTADATVSAVQQDQLSHVELSRQQLSNTLLGYASYLDDPDRADDINRCIDHLIRVARECR